MFDNSLPGPDALATTAVADLVTAIGGFARIEAAAAARRLAAIAELVARRSDRTLPGTPDAARWACDSWDATAAEVAAAGNISHRMASGQMYLALALRNRVPQVGGLFLAGVINARLAATIAWHTTLIEDPAALCLVDTALADRASGLALMSAAKAATLIEALIERHDPAALRSARYHARGRDFVVDTTNSRSGTTPMWGRLYATDAEVLDRRLTELAGSLCADDPRTLAQRRADALGALAGGTDLACGCGRADCPVAGRNPGATNVVIHVIAEEAALAAEPDPQMNGATPASRPVTPGMTVAEMLTPEPEPDPPAVISPATIVGGGAIPATLVAELINRGAVVKPLRLLADAPAEPRYRPSAALAAFVRCRDLTCRFPGCDRPATHCDIDHAVPYPYGPTHPANLRCLCRKHHLLKTFWSGPGGWRDRQYPDGVIVWTSPTGQTYRTAPGSRNLFPGLCLSAGAPPVVPLTPGGEIGRTLMMPIRCRTRAQNRARCIAAERARNAAPPGLTPRSGSPSPPRSADAGDETDRPPACGAAGPGTRAGSGSPSNTSDPIPP